MATYNAAFEATPAGTDAPSTIDDKIREFKEAVTARIGNEHGNYKNTAEGADGSEAADWVHREGSARAYYCSDAPTQRPDEATALDSTGSNDDGRLFVSNGTYHPIKVWSGGSWLSTSVNYANYAVSSGTTTDNGPYNITVKHKVFSLGSWNMDAVTPGCVCISTGISPTDILWCDVSIICDGNHSVAPLYYYDEVDTEVAGRWEARSTDSIIVSRYGGGKFDSTRYNSTGFNRGWLTVHYKD